MKRIRKRFIPIFEYQHVSASSPQAKNTDIIERTVDLRTNHVGNILRFNFK